MSLGEPRVLTGMELMDFEQSDRCQKSWYAKSLMLTIAEIREEQHYEIQMMNGQIGELRNRLNWFEETYAVRAFQPMFAQKVKGQSCPHCKKHGAAKLTSDTHENWICFECKQQWEVELTAEQLAERQKIRDECNRCRRDRRRPRVTTPIIATSITNTAVGNVAGAEC